MTQPVSVITVVWNGERFLGEALASLRAQTPPPAEIIVVDGPSTDRTRAVAEAAGVRYVRQRGSGLAAARNEGVALASQPLIAFLDHDDRWLPDKLSSQVAALAAQPACDYSLTWMEFIDEHGRPVAAAAGGARVAAMREAATPGALLARRALFERLGGFDPAFAIGCDADWFTRARDAGAGCALVPQALLQKRLHTGNLSNRGAQNRADMFRIARRSIARQASPPHAHDSSRS